MDNELKKYISDIKRDLLLHIIYDMQDKKMTLGTAQQLSKDFLALMPARDKGDVLDKLYSLSKEYIEARIVFVKYIGPFEEIKKEKALQVIRKYMQVGDYENALLYAKGVK